MHQIATMTAMEPDAAMAVRDRTRVTPFVIDGRTLAAWMRRSRRGLQSRRPFLAGKRSTYHKNTHGLMSSDVRTVATNVYPATEAA